MATIGRPSNVANIVYVPNAQMSKVAIKYPNQDFIAPQVMPGLRVKNESDVYYKFKASHLDVVDDYRAISAAPNEVSWEIDETPKYTCQERALEEFLPDRIRQNTDPAIMADTHTVEDLTQKTLLAQELRAVNLYSGNAVAWEGSLAKKWDDADCVTIKADVASAIKQVKYACGFKPNTVIMNQDVYDAIVDNPKLQNLFKYLPVPADTVFSVEKMFALMFGVTNVKVAGGLYNQANKGQTLDLGEIWGDDVYLSFVNPSPALMKPSFCYRIYTVDRNISNRYDGIRNGIVYRIQSVATEHVVLPNAAVKISGVLTDES
jgi:hypothetical protein